MALMHLKVYYKFCPMEKQNLAIFPRTISGPDEVSLEEAQGACVPNAVQVMILLNKFYSTLYINFIYLPFVNQEILTFKECNESKKQKTCGMPGSSANNRPELEFCEGVSQSAVRIQII